MNIEKGDYVITIENKPCVKVWEVGCFIKENLIIGIDIKESEKQGFKVSREISLDDILPYSFKNITLLEKQK